MTTSFSAPDDGRARLGDAARAVYDLLVAQLRDGRHGPGETFTAAAVAASWPERLAERVAQEAIGALVLDGWLMRMGNDRAARVPGGEDLDPAADIRRRISANRLRPGDQLDHDLRMLISTENRRRTARRQLAVWGLATGKARSMTVAPNAVAVILLQDRMLARALIALHGRDPELHPGATIGHQVFTSVDGFDVSTDPGRDVAWVVHALWRLGLLQHQGTGGGCVYTVRPGAAWLAERMRFAEPE